MEIWSVLVIAIGTLAVSILAAGLIVSTVAPGVATYLAAIFGGILSLFQTFTQFLRQAIQVLIDHMPRPLKLGLFIVIFAAIGGLAYNLTAGAQYVCAESTCAAGVDNCTTSNVKDVGWFEGVAFKMLPHDSLPAFLRTIEKEEELDNVSKLPDVILGAEVSGDSFGADGLITKDENFVWEGNTYVVYYALASYVENFLKLGDDFFRTPNKQLWDSWRIDGLEAGDKVKYAICFDRATDTCTLKRNSCDNLLFQADIYTRDVGNIQFYLSGGYLTGIYSGRTPLVDNILNLGGLLTSIKDCKDLGLTSDDDLVEYLAEKDISPSSSKYEAYSKILSIKTQVDLRASQNFFDVSKEDVPMYYVAHAGIFHTLVSGDEVVFQDLEIVPEGEQNPLDAKINDLLVGGESVSFKESDVYRVVCDDETSDPFDTKPLVLGIDILNWKLMALFVLLGAIVSFYMWYRELWN